MTYHVVVCFVQHWNGQPLRICNVEINNTIGSARLLVFHRWRTRTCRLARSPRYSTSCPPSSQGRCCSVAVWGACLPLAVRNLQFCHRLPRGSRNRLPLLLTALIFQLHPIASPQAASQWPRNGRAKTGNTKSWRKSRCFWLPISAYPF